MIFFLDNELETQKKQKSEEYKLQINEDDPPILEWRISLKDYRDEFLMLIKPNSFIDYCE